MECGWGWGTVPQGTMRPDMVVFLPPHFNEHLRFHQRIEYLPIQQFIPQLPIERFNVSVLPGASRFDEQGCHSQVV